MGPTMLHSCSNTCQFSILWLHIYRIIAFLCALKTCLILIWPDIPCPPIKAPHSMPAPHFVVWTGISPLCAQYGQRLCNMSRWRTCAYIRVCYKILAVWHLAGQKCSEKYSCSFHYTIRHHECNSWLLIYSRSSLSTTPASLLGLVCPLGIRGQTFGMLILQSDWSVAGAWFHVLPRGHFTTLPVDTYYTPKNFDYTCELKMAPTTRCITVTVPKHSCSHWMLALTYL